MKNLKDILKKPVILWGLIGVLGLGIGTLTFKNIGLKNQNNYFFKEYSKTRDMYTNLVGKYNKLRRDSAETSTQHLSEIISVKKDNFKLAYKIDSLENDYLNFAENSKETYLKLDFEQDKRDFFKALFALSQENEFCKNYVGYLDSLLLKCDLNKTLEDRKSFK